MASNLEVHRTGARRGRRAKGLRQKIGESLDHLDARIESRERLEQRKIVYLLIHMPMSMLGARSTGDRDDRRAGKIRIAETCRQIGGSDRLRHTHAGFVGSASITVGHIYRRLFPVSHYAGDPEPIHLSQRRCKDNGHEKNMRYASGSQSFRNIL
jgi:hypothetical protein